MAEKHGQKETLKVTIYGANFVHFQMDLFNTNLNIKHLSVTCMR